MMLKERGRTGGNSLLRSGGRAREDLIHSTHRLIGVTAEKDSVDALSEGWIDKEDAPPVPHDRSLVRGIR